MPTDPDTSDGERLPEWVVADLFDSPARERVLCRLHRADEPVVLCDLVADLTAASPTETRREVRMSLFQDHLPKLTATGVVELDSAHGTLRLGDAAALAPRLADCGES